MTQFMLRKIHKIVSCMNWVPSLMKHSMQHLLEWVLVMEPFWCNIELLVKGFSPSLWLHGQWTGLVWFLTGFDHRRPNSMLKIASLRRVQIAQEKKLQPREGFGDAASLNWHKRTRWRVMHQQECNCTHTKNKLKLQHFDYDCKGRVRLMVRHLTPGTVTIAGYSTGDAHRSRW